MTFTEACLPTHAMLARAAAGGPVLAAPPRPPEALAAALSRTRATIQAHPLLESPVRKYVIVRFGDSEYCIVFSNQLPHRRMVPLGTIPVSAGFLAIYNGSIKVFEDGSESLHLGPRPGDVDMLHAFLLRKEAP